MEKRTAKGSHAMQRSKILLGLILSSILFCGAVFTVDQDKESGPAREWVVKAGKALKAGEHGKALDYAAEAIRIKPDYAVAYNTRGAIFNYAKQPRMAEQDFNTAIKLQPDFSAAYLNRGNARRDLGDYDEAVSDYSRSLALEIENVTAFFERAKTYQMMKKHDLAIADFTRAIELKPDHAKAYFERGKVFAETGRTDKAREDMDRATQLSPKSEEFRQELARLGKPALSGEMAKRKPAEKTEQIPQKKSEEKIAKTPQAAPKEIPVEMPAEMPEEISEEAPEFVPPPFDTASARTLPPSDITHKRVLTPFKGYSLADTCAQSIDAEPGVPWQSGTSGDSGPVPASELSQHEALLRHTMRGLQVLYGKMSPDEEKNFYAFWAPFSDFPTKNSLQYFKAIAPLLDEALLTLNELEGQSAGLAAGLQEVLISGENPGSIAMAIGEMRYRSLKAGRAKLDDLLKRIEALGNPPNPLVAKCGAKKRHRKALKTKSEAPGLLGEIKASNFSVIEVASPEQRANIIAGFDFIERGGIKAKHDWENNQLRMVSGDDDYDNPCGGIQSANPDLPSMPKPWVARIESTGVFSADGNRIEKMTLKRLHRNCSSGSPSSPELYSQFEVVNVPLFSIEKAPEWTRFTYHLKGQTAAGNTQTISAREEWVPEGNAEAVIKISFIKGNEKFARTKPEIQYIQQAAAANVPTRSPEKAAGAQGKGQASKQDEESSGLEKDPKLIAESIAQFEARAEQFQRDAARWEADAQAEKDPKRRDELEARALERYAQAQAELDTAASLRTGTIVRTRTDWDEKQTQAIVYRAQAELAVFAMENELMGNIAKLDDRIAGKDEVKLREQTQKRVLEAVKSPERLQKLAGIYADLQTQIVEQGEREMLSAEEKVAMWDDRIAMAEKVQFAASTSILLYGLWAPAEMGSLGLGFAGATGFAEDGVLGASKAVFRSVSDKVDVVLSAYEGAVKIDPQTKEPAGIWGAINGAIWCIGTNKAMGALSRRIQNMKADMAKASAFAALTRQAAGGKGFKAAAKASPSSKALGHDFMSSFFRPKGMNKDPEPLKEKSFLEKKDLKRPLSKKEAEAKEKADAALAKQAAGGKGVQSAAKATGKGRLEEYDFRMGDEHYHAELEAAKTPEDRAAVKKKYPVHAARDDKKAEIDELTQKSEEAIRNGEDPQKVNEEFNRDLEAIHDKYKEGQRTADHYAACAKMGLNCVDPTPEEKAAGIDNRDIINTGSMAKNVDGDMDFAAKGGTPHERWIKSKKLVSTWIDAKHHVVEYGDRWVDYTTDTTLWKPEFSQDLPGSSSYDAAMTFGTMPHSDKFAPPGAVEFTSNAGGKTGDPLGAVIANAGKAVAAGLGNDSEKDLHTIGKSAVKAAQAAGVQVEPELMSQIQALKDHKLPVQAGIYNLGDSPEVKEEKIQDFLRKVETVMGQSYEAGRAKSENNFKALEQQAAQAKTPDEAYRLRAKAASYKAADNAALATIAKYSPGLGKKMPLIIPDPSRARPLPVALPAGTVPFFTGPDNTVSGFGDFGSSLIRSRENAASTPPLAFDGNVPTFTGLGKRCEAAAKIVEQKISMVKPGSEEANYLKELKNALAEGAKNPAEAVRTVRGISGQELAVVLEELGAPKGKT